MEAEIVDTMNTSLPDEPDELPVEMAETIAALHLLQQGKSARHFCQTISGRLARPIPRHFGTLEVLGLCVCSASSVLS